MSSWSRSRHPSSPEPYRPEIVELPCVTVNPCAARADVAPYSQTLSGASHRTFRAFRSARGARWRERGIDGTTSWPIAGRDPGSAHRRGTPAGQAVEPDPGPVGGRGVLAGHVGVYRHGGRSE